MTVNRSRRGLPATRSIPWAIPSPSRSSGTDTDEVKQDEAIATNRIQRGTPVGYRGQDTDRDILDPAARPALYSTDIQGESPTRRCNTSRLIGWVSRTSQRASPSDSARPPSTVDWPVLLCRGWHRSRRTSSWCGSNGSRAASALCREPLHTVRSWIRLRYGLGTRRSEDPPRSSFPLGLMPKIDSGTVRAAEDEFRCADDRISWV